MAERSVVSVRAVARAAAILRAFTPERPALTLTEIAAIAGLDIGTTRRLLLTLVDCGLVAQTPAALRYVLGHGIAELARAVPEGPDWRQRTLPLLQQLAHATRATIFLAIESQDKALCLERLYGNQAVVQLRWWSVGEGVALTAGAGPRVLLAGLPDARVEAVLRRKIVPLTAKSITAPAAIRRDIRRIRAQGWALSVEETVEGITAIAAPVRDAAGATVAVVSVAGLTGQVLHDGAPRYLDTLLRCTREISSLAR